MGINIDNTNVKAFLSIGGVSYNFKQFRLSQVYDKHHEVEIHLYQDIGGGSFIEDSDTHINMIANSIVLDIQQGDNNANAYVFKGVVTDVKLVAEHGKNGVWIVKGASPTILLERGKRMELYSDKTLDGIFEDVTQGVISNLFSSLNAPVYSASVPFLLQYNETDWAFLRRIAYLFGENLWYSGSELLFGEYEEWEPELLLYNADIDRLEFNYRMYPNQGKYYQYVAEDDEHLESELPGEISNGNSTLDAIASCGDGLTMGKPSLSQFETPFYNAGEISEMSEKIKSRNAARTLVVNGTTKSHLPAIGRLIRIEMPESIEGRKDYGTYRVIKATHQIDEKGIYTNTFEAVPASLKTMPVDEPAIPFADSILGYVADTEDPLGQGRVIVDFKFANNYNFSWMRVMTPNAGGARTSLNPNLGPDGNQVEQNRGMVFIPEKGDTVMVGFEMGDPTRPYVMGSVFHGSNAGGGGVNNTVKSITTRSGNKVIFDDEAGSITVSDSNESCITLNGDGTITISAPSKISMIAPEISLDAESCISITGNESVAINSEGSINLAAKSEINVESKANMAIKSMTKEESHQTYSLEGTTVDVNGKTATNIKGLIVNLN